MSEYDNRAHSDRSYQVCAQRYKLFMQTYIPIEPIKTIKQKANVNDDPFLD